MTYMNQEQKAVIAARLKDVVPAGWKYSLEVENYQLIKMCITSAPVDLIAEAQESRDRAALRKGEQSGQLDGYFEVYVHQGRNQKETFSKSGDVMQLIADALNTGNYNASDSYRDYSDVGHYVRLTIGRHDKPFVVSLSGDTPKKKSKFPSM